MLYKYRSINDWTKELFKSQKVWLAKPSTLNDPFECRIPKYSKSEIQAHAEEKMKNQMMGFIMSMPLSDGDNFLLGRKKGADFYGKNEREVRILSKRIRRAKDIPQKYRLINNFLKGVGLEGMSSPYDQINSLNDTLSSVGVFSLSEDPLNMLMWSHYGSNHEGIAIGFEKNNKLANEDYCQPVTYEKELPKVDITKGIMNGVSFFAGGQRPQNYVQLKDPQIQRVLLTKTADWAYEREWRYFEPNHGSFDFPGKMTEVIFGLKCSQAEIDSIVELCRENFSHVVTFKKVVNANGSSKLQLKPMKI
jgi:hypothetical protein